MKIKEFSLLNLARCLRWHPQGIKSWSLSDWMTATDIEDARRRAEKL